MVKASGLKEKGKDLVMELRIDVHEYVRHFGVECQSMGRAQRRWLKGKIKQEFLAKLDEAFPDKEGSDA